ADAAADRRRAQPDRGTAGKIEIDRSAALRKIRADRQKTEYAALLAALKSAVCHTLDLAEGDRAQRALETPRFASLCLGDFPAKTVSDQHKGADLPIVGEIAHRNERVLQAGGNDGKIVGVLGAQPKRAVRRHSAAFRCARRRLTASPRSAHSRGRDDRRG